MTQQHLTIACWFPETRWYKLIRHPENMPQLLPNPPTHTVRNVDFSRGMHERLLFPPLGSMKYYVIAAKSALRARAARI